MREGSDGKGMSLGSYCELVEGLRAAGYASVDFERVEPARRDLILRHDVDMCLFRALEMAEAEHRIGVRSHYFVLVNTESYNAGSGESRGILRRIRELGHEIGLHFDSLDIAAGDQRGLDLAVAMECEILGRHADTEIRVVTFHRPAKWLLNHAGTLGGRIHGYQPRFFTEIGYCSDSEGRFRFHHPFDHPAVLAGHGLQLVIHPIWWCASVEEGPLDKLRRYRREREQRLDDALAANCRPFGAARSAS